MGQVVPCEKDDELAQYKSERLEMLDVREGAMDRLEGRSQGIMERTRTDNLQFIFKK